MRESRPSDGVERAVEITRRRRGLTVFAFTAVLAAGVSVVVFLPNIFRATATLLVERQQVPEDFVRSTVTSAVDSRLQTISQEILSRSRLQRLIQDLDLYPDSRGKVSEDELVERMRKDIRLESRALEQLGENENTVAFAISYGGSDPRRVAQVANTLASFYIEENLKVRAKQATGTAEFLENELEKIKQKLDEQELLVSKFKEAHMGELPEQQDANLATLERLNAQIRLNGYQQVRAREQQAALTKQLAEAGKAVRGPRGDSVSERIAILKRELAAMQSRFSDKYPDVVRVKAEIAALEAKRGEAKDGRGAGLSGSPYTLELQQSVKAIEADLAALKSEEKSLKESIGEYQRRVENAPRREQEFQGLSRDYETTKENYRSLLKRYKEAQLAESLEERQKGEQFRILDPATVPERPAAPNRPRLILFCVALALAVAVGAAILAERVDASFHSVDDLRAFSKVPVLVSIPRIVIASDTRRDRVRFWLTTVAAVASLFLIVGASYLVAHGNERFALLLVGTPFSGK